MATIPTGIVDGIVDIPVKLTLHEQVGTTNWLRVQEANSSGQTERFRQNIAIGPCVDCTHNLTVRMDFSQWRTGRNEMRFSLNVPDEQPGVSGAQRMFQSTGWQVCVRSCTPSYRSGDFIEARGWYDNAPQGESHEYANARLTTPLSSVRSGGTIGVSLRPGAGGLPTVGHGVYIDPDFHHGSAGIVVREGTGPFTGNVTLPTLASGAHKLVLVSHDGQNAGVLMVPFVVP